MVVIRLSRRGATKRPFFHIVAANSQRAATKRNLEKLGYYNPMAAAKDTRLHVLRERVAYWQGVGAQVTPTVQRLLRTAQKAAAPQAAPENPAA